jgi:hypothetical protein
VTRARGLITIGCGHISSGARMATQCLALYHPHQVTKLAAEVYRWGPDDTEKLVNGYRLTFRAEKVNAMRAN